MSLGTSFKLSTTARSSGKVLRRNRLYFLFLPSRRGSTSMAYLHTCAAEIAGPPYSGVATQSPVAATPCIS
jgi:hypothetical protein